MSRVTLHVELKALENWVAAEMCEYHFARIQAQANYEFVVSLDALHFEDHYITTSRQVRDLVSSAMALAVSQAARGEAGREGKTHLVTTDHLKTLLQAYSHSHYLMYKP